MNFFNRLKDQVNPFDGGKSFNSPQKSIPQAPLNLRDAQSAIMQGSLVGSVPGLQSGARPQATSPMKYPMNLQRGRGYAEDDGMVQGPQGYSPINADVANFSSQSLQPNMQPQYEDAYTPDLALNQTYTQGNPQLTRSGYSVQRGGNPQEDFLRKLLGY